MEAANWIALTSVLATACIAVYSMRMSQGSAQKDRRAAASQVEREREQARLQEAYVSLLSYMGEVGAWAQTILPVIGGDPRNPKALHDVPPIKEQVAVEARLTAFGSNAARDGVEEWRQVLMEIRRLVLQIKIRADRVEVEVQAQPWTDYTTLWGELDGLRAKESARRSELEALIRQELGAIREG